MQFPAGRRDIKAAWWRPLETPSASGAMKVTFALQGYVWISVKERAGSEIVDADQTLSLNQITVLINNNPSIRAKDQLRFSGRVLEIEGKQNSDERKRGHFLQCVEVKP